MPKNSAISDEELSTRIAALGEDEELFLATVVEVVKRMLPPLVDQAVAAIKIPEPKIPVSVVGASVSKGNLLSLSLSDGTVIEAGTIVAERGEQGFRGPRGHKGPRGDYMQKIAMSDDGDFIVSYSDGVEVNIGKAPRGSDGRAGSPGRDGSDGKDGRDGVSVIDFYTDLDGAVFARTSDGKAHGIGCLPSVDAWICDKSFKDAVLSIFNGSIEDLSSKHHATQSVQHIAIDEFIVDNDRVLARMEDAKVFEFCSLRALQGLGAKGEPGVGIQAISQLTPDSFTITTSEGNETTIHLPVGPAGRDGVDGKDGRDGVDGEHGLQGQDGRDGIDGKDGSDGAPGAAGQPGRDGIDGKDGRDGKDGADGAAGQPGKDGRDGIDGVDGKDGRDGVDGKDAQPHPLAATSLSRQAQQHIENCISSTLTPARAFFDGNRNLHLVIGSLQINVGVVDGQDAEDWPTGARLDQNGHLFLDFKSGSAIDVGHVCGRDGEEGPRGKPGMNGHAGRSVREASVKVIDKVNSLVIEYDDGTVNEPLPLPVVRGPGMYFAGKYKKGTQYYCQADNPLGPVADIVTHKDKLYICEITTSLPPPGNGWHRFDIVTPASESEQ